MVPCACCVPAVPMCPGCGAEEGWTSSAVPQAGDTSSSLIGKQQDNHTGGQDFYFLGFVAYGQHSRVVWIENLNIGDVT